MKKNKLLITLLSTAGITSAVTPLVTLTSCGNNEKLGNLMTEYTPTIKPLAAQNFATPMDAVKKYVSECKKNPEIFAQDLLYTLSRGMPQYNAYMSEFCEITKTDYDAQVSNITVDETKLQIGFDLKMHVVFDYSKTKRTELEFYDLNYQAWDAVTVAHFNFDFNTTDFAQYDIRGQRRQMTSYAGATQFGISEFGSTTKMISQKGTGINLDGKKESLDAGEGDECHFILPTYDWYLNHSPEGITKYNEYYAQAWQLWLEYWGMQALVLTFKYYMPSNSCPASDDTPRSLDFGSYYMQNANVGKTFAIGKDQDIEGVTDLYGFNLSLDSIKNLENLKNSALQEEESFTYKDEELTLPNGGGVTKIADGAFDGAFSNYTNIGLPSEVKKLVIPSNFLNIGERAFAETGGLESIRFERQGQNDPLVLANHAFSTLRDVRYIDFSDFGKENFGKITTTNPTQPEIKPFESITIGREAGLYGTIKLPTISDSETTLIANWENKLAALGLPKYDKDTGFGWNYDRT